MSTVEQARARVASARTAALERGERLRPAVTRVLSARRHLSVLGWTVLLSAVVFWILGAALDWVEFTMAAVTAATLVAACGLMTLGRARLSVQVTVEPQRVRVGDPAAGQVSVVNRAKGPLLPIGLELPVGDAVAHFGLPALRPGHSHDELFVVPTDRRSVVSIGPATTVRGDPLGLARREVAWTDVVELYVHPATVALESLGAGLLRDLEGRTSEDMSTSDLAFHALRDYQPGDDRRYIHWRSSAKAGRFLVRQFLDTRRAHLVTVVDGDLTSYADPDDFEVAISAAASMAVRATLDEQDVTVVAADQAAQSEPGRRVLDCFARAVADGAGLASVCTRAARLAPDTSVAVLLTGSALPNSDLRTAANRFPPETRVVALRVDRTAPTSVRSMGSLTVLSLNGLAQLPVLLSGTLT